MLSQATENSLVRKVNVFSVTSESRLNDVIQSKSFNVMSQYMLTIFFENIWQYGKYTVLNYSAWPFRIKETVIIVNAKLSICLKTQ